MKYTLRAFSILAVSVFALCGISSCGSSQEEMNKKLTEATVVVDSILGVDAPQTPVQSITVAVVQNGIDIDVMLVDSIIDGNRVQSELLNYYIARQIKNVGVDELNQVLKTLDETEGTLNLTIVGAAGYLKEFRFTPDQLRNLYKAKGSQLNVPTVKAQVIGLFENDLPVNEISAEADTTTMEIDGGFLTYTVKFEKKKYVSKQGVLTSLYLEPLKQKCAQLGVLKSPIIEMLDELGIDGIRVVFVSADDEKEVKQAFPWRIIAE